MRAVDLADNKPLLSYALALFGVFLPLSMKPKLQAKREWVNNAQCSADLLLNIHNIL